MNSHENGNVEIIDPGTRPARTRSRSASPTGATRATARSTSPSRKAPMSRRSQTPTTSSCVKAHPRRSRRWPTTLTPTLTRSGSSPVDDVPAGITAVMDSTAGTTHGGRQHRRHLLPVVHDHGRAHDRRPASSAWTSPPPVPTCRPAPRTTSGSCQTAVKCSWTCWPTTQTQPAASSPSSN